ncbi:SIS domain-containing protein [Labrys wisconsinensis]|uniref:Glucosamine--fructose-6-phosphate aminotransferase (Isomerizing) n=1 Tax=Labrys wisconsinensis TaxID=425677 RepID=A0ABU0JKE4_9HYPH|nr:SIS domain-containing protein [Labrys wisconsinensis]MDQ0474060.1 glucosamine--fructose-6-phosphate aminotransferase (isomerizing) [Labrys wisconsinensis]
MSGRTRTIADFIAGQPDAIGEIADAVEAQLADLPPLPAEGELHLIGSGTSFNALLAAEQRLSQASGLQVRTLPPLAFLDQRGPALTRLRALVVLSHSGASTTSVAAARRGIELGLRTIVVTGHADSPLGALAADRILLPVQDETVGAKTKGYTASLLALLMLARRLETGASGALPGLDAFVPAYRALVAEAGLWAAGLAAELADADAIAVLGQGRHLGSAHEGALKIAEIAGLPTLPAETEDACHGRFFGYTLRTRAFFIAASAAQKRLAATAADALASFGVRAAIADLSGAGLASPHDVALPWPAPSATPELDLLAAAVPLQWLGQRLALQRGRVPEVMPYPGLGMRIGLRGAPGSAP